MELKKRIAKMLMHVVAEALTLILPM